MITDETLRKQVIEMWADMRRDGDVLVDAPGLKVGMPYTLPYEGVCFPVEEDGQFSIVRIPDDKVERFALALVSLVPVSRQLDAECDAEMVAGEAISKARGD